MQKGAQQRGEEGEGVQPVLRDRRLQPETGSPARPLATDPQGWEASSGAAGKLPGLSSSPWQWHSSQSNPFLLKVVQQVAISGAPFQSRGWLS